MTRSAPVTARIYIPARPAPARTRALGPATATEMMPGYLLCQLKVKIRFLGLLTDMHRWPRLYLDILVALDIKVDFNKKFLLSVG